MNSNIYSRYVKESFFGFRKSINMDKHSIPQEAVVWRCSVEKVFLEILQNSQENISVRPVTLLTTAAVDPGI